MNAKKRNLIAIILLVTAFVALLNQTLMITALPVMAKTLHISLNLAQWLTAGYVLTVGLITPISANLIEKFTSRQIFLSIVLVFILGTLIGPLTNNFAIILLGRLIQAAAGGVLVTFVMVSMISLYAPEQRGLVMGYVSLVISAGPAIGPTLSGLIMNFYPWQALFYLILPIMILAFIAGWLWLPNYTEKHATTIDVRSVISSILGIGLIMSSISILRKRVVGKRNVSHWDNCHAVLYPATIQSQNTIVGSESVQTAQLQHDDCELDADLCDSHGDGSADSGLC
ncbi:MFS transporter [Lacticaseibacillus saniviri]|uniref:MFS transporter n=1 Tax=Lacticaseibacillus saniviri TaxID=931533 RepID=UPI0009EAFE31